MTGPKALKNTISLLSLLALVGCAAAPAAFLSGAGSLAEGGGSTAINSVPRGPAIEIENTSIIAAQDANDNTAVPVAFVVAYDQGVLVKLLSMTARQFFQQERQLKNDYPNIIEIWRWEVIPGQSLNNQRTKLSGDEPIGAVVYSDYTSRGDHRVRVGAGNQLRIELKKEQFFVTTRDQ